MFSRAANHRPFAPAPTGQAEGRSAWRLGISSGERHPPQVPRREAHHQQEIVYTYEGTDTVQVMTVGRDTTGIDVSGRQRLARVMIFMGS